MAIYLHLQTHGMAPKEIACIIKAYEQTLRTLCVKDRDDPLTELVAKTIIKIAQTGIKDPAQIQRRRSANSKCGRYVVPNALGT